MQKYKLFLKKQNFFEKFMCGAEFMAFYGVFFVLISTHLNKSILWPFLGEFRHFKALVIRILPKKKKRP